MKTTFQVTAAPGLTSFKLRKKGEKEEQEFASLPQAMLYAQMLTSGEGRMIVYNSAGKRIACMTV